MKRHLLTTILFLSIGAMMFFLANCGEEDPPKQNEAPTVKITSPAANAAIKVGETVQITVTASDPDGSVSNVTISIDNVEEESFNSPPYSASINTTGADVGTHTIKAVATDNGGLTATDQISVTVTGEAPTVTTADITDITGDSAVGGGNVTDDGGVSVSARGVVWSTTMGPTVDTNDGKTEDGAGTGEFTSNLTLLTTGITYYVKAYATNSEGTAYGEEKSFTTLNLPTVISGVVNNITSNSAEGEGLITDDGGSEVTARGLVWNITTDPTLDDKVGFTEEGTGIGGFTSVMTNLERFTVYYVRAYATTMAGTAYGESSIYFKTLPDQPTITTIDITDIEAHLAKSGGEITDDGGDDSFVKSGLVWSSSPNPTFESNEGYYENTDGNYAFEGPISGIDALTTYYVRAYVLNSTLVYAYGEEKTFTSGSFSYQTGTFMDARDGLTYNTITISGQTWMAENLAYLPEVCPSNTDCGYWVYDYQGTDTAVAKATSNYMTYGVLYDWETSKNVCPTGWHLPSDEEYQYFEAHIGMDLNTIGDWYNRGTDEGGKMKEMGTVHWLSPNAGATNYSGFTALPGGQRESTGGFNEIGQSAYFWTSSMDGTWIISRFIYYNYEHISAPGIFNTYMNTGYSVRCIQD